MTYSKTSEVDKQLGIAAHWRPYLEAVGCDTRGWTPWEIYRLAELVWRNSTVETLHHIKMDAWFRQPRLYTDNLMELVPPRRLLLEAVSELSAALKKEIRDHIQARKAVGA